LRREPGLRRTAVSRRVGRRRPCQRLVRACRQRTYARTRSG
jgi:hypothetical protein